MKNSGPTINIFATINNIETTIICVKNLLDSYEPGKIFLNVPDSALKDFSKVYGRKQIIPDSALLSPEFDRNLKKSSRYNWNKQQVLKLLQVEANPTDTLIIDGDTVLTPRMIKKVKNHNKLYFLKENPKFYMPLIEKLSQFHDFRIQKNEKSFVTNFGYFYKSDYENINMDSILNLMLRYESLDMPISEYQLNGVIRSQKCADKERIKTFRRADLLGSTPKDIDLKYDCYSFEYGHSRSLIKSLLAKILYHTIRYSW